MHFHYHTETHDPYQTLHFYAQAITQEPSTWRDYLVDETGFLKEFVQKPVNLIAIAQILEVTGDDALGIAAQLNKKFLVGFICEPEECMAFMQQFPKAANLLGIPARCADRLITSNQMIHLIKQYPIAAINLLRELHARDLLTKGEQVLEVIAFCPAAIAILQNDSRIAQLRVDAEKIELAFPELYENWQKYTYAPYSESEDNTADERTVPPARNFLNTGDFISDIDNDKEFPNLVCTHEYDCREYHPGNSLENKNPTISSIDNDQEFSHVVCTIELDSMGNIVKKEYMNSITGYAYVADNRIIFPNLPNVSSSSFPVNNEQLEENRLYDPQGKLQQIENRNSITRFIYDSMGERHPIIIPKFSLAVVFSVLASENLTPRKLKDSSSIEETIALREMLMQAHDVYSLQPYFYRFITIEDKVFLAMWLCQQSLKNNVFNPTTSLLDYIEKIFGLYLMPFQTLTLDNLPHFIHAFEKYDHPIADLWCSFLLTHTADKNNLDADFPQETREILLLDAMSAAERVLLSPDDKCRESARELLWHIRFMYGDEFSSLKSYHERIQMRLGENLALFRQSEGFQLGFFAKPVLPSHLRISRKLSPFGEINAILSEARSTQNLSPSDQDIEPIENDEPTVKFNFYKPN